MVKTGIRPPKMEYKYLIQSALDAPSDFWAFVSQRQTNASDLPRTSDSSTNQIVFHGLPSNALHVSGFILGSLKVLVYFILL